MNFNLIPEIISLISFEKLDVKTDDCNFEDHNYIVRRQAHLSSYFNLVKDLEVSLSKNGSLVESYEFSTGPDNTPGKEKTPLMRSSESNALFTAQFLLAKGANVSARSRKGLNLGKTPLHIAARFSSVDVARLLLVEGCADVNATDKDGNTPLHR